MYTSEMKYSWKADEDVKQNILDAWFVGGSPLLRFASWYLWNICKEQIL